MISCKSVRNKTHNMHYKYLQNIRQPLQHHNFIDHLWKIQPPQSGAQTLSCCLLRLTLKSSVATSGPVCPNNKLPSADVMQPQEVTSCTGGYMGIQKGQPDLLDWPLHHHRNWLFIITATNWRRLTVHISHLRNTRHLDSEQKTYTFDRWRSQVIFLAFFQVLPSLIFSATQTHPRIPISYVDGRSEFLGYWSV